MDARSPGGRVRARITNVRFMFAVTSSGARRGWLTLGALLSTLALFGFTACNPPPPPPPGPPTVTVSGNKLLNGAGQTTRLLGVNHSGTEYACVQGWGLFDGPSDAASITAIKSWKTNVVRVPLNETCWLGINGVGTQYGGANYRKAIGDYVTRLHAAGFVVILDMHWSAPGTQKATEIVVMAAADHAPAFWTSVATYFKNDPGVIFDLYNEPHDISWPCWRDGCTTAQGWKTAGMQSLVNAVRGTGAKQPIMLGGLGWASDLSKWLTYKPNDPLNQLIASFHFYNFSGCSAKTCWDSTVAPVSQSVPVVTGEFGQDDCAHGLVDQYMNWADVKGISYLGWTWNTGGGWTCTSGPSLITNYNGTPTNYGVGLRDHLAAF